MASSQLKAKQASAAVLTPTQMRVVELLGDGVSSAAIAKRLAKGDPKLARKWRMRLRHWAKDPFFQKALFDLHKGESVLDLGRQVKAIGDRASRGRVDAAKLIWAVNGFHNERVDHRHSGEIQLNISIPRPKTVEDHVAGPGKIEEGYVDADVVED